MNQWVELLAEGSLDKENLTHIRIEDNVGESIHIHLPGSRLELSIDEFYKFHSEIIKANKELKDGNN